jgi:hypothetical protein
MGSKRYLLRFHVVTIDIYEFVLFKVSKEVENKKCQTLFSTYPKYCTDGLTVYF